MTQVWKSRNFLALVIARSYRLGWKEFQSRGNFPLFGVNFVHRFLPSSGFVSILICT